MNLKEYIPWALVALAIPIPVYLHYVEKIFKKRKAKKHEEARTERDVYDEEEIICDTLENHLRKDLSPLAKYLVRVEERGFKGRFPNFDLFVKKRPERIKEWKSELDYQKAKYRAEIDRELSSINLSLIEGEYRLAD